MTKLLQQAMAEAAKLSDDAQDELARWILATLESDQQWNQAFEHSQDLLEQLASEALAEFHAGETELLDADTL